ncbi:MAG TPA: hypothetical protein VL349_08530, partial [Terriglobales bacterium]|nr:hypothetical protein [Terriglobales bacterium]
EPVDFAQYGVPRIASGRVDQERLSRACVTAAKRIDRATGQTVREKLERTLEVGRCAGDPRIPGAGPDR